jgi:hypothetical protein
MVTDQAGRNTMVGVCKWEVGEVASTDGEKIKGWRISPSTCGVFFLLHESNNHRQVAYLWIGEDVALKRSSTGIVCHTVAAKSSSSESSAILQSVIVSDTLLSVPCGE